MSYLICSTEHGSNGGYYPEYGEPIWMVYKFKFFGWFPKYIKSFNTLEEARTYVEYDNSNPILKVEYRF